MVHHFDNWFLCRCYKCTTCFGFSGWCLPRTLLLLWRLPKTSTNQKCTCYSTFSTAPTKTFTAVASSTQTACWHEVTINLFAPGRKNYWLLGTYQNLFVWYNITSNHKTGSLLSCSHSWTHVPRLSCLPVILVIHEMTILSQSTLTGYYPLWR